MNTQRRNMKAVLIASAGVTLLMASSGVQAQSIIRYTRTYNNDSSYCRSRDTVATVSTRSPRSTRRVYVEPTYQDSRVVVTYDEPRYVEPVYYDDDNYVQYVRYPSRSHRRSHHYSYDRSIHHRGNRHYSRHNGGHRIGRVLNRIGRNLHRIGHLASRSHHRRHNSHRSFGISIGRSSHGRSHGRLSHRSHR